MKAKFSMTLLSFENKFLAASYLFWKAVIKFKEYNL
jgi:hypothetical protein